MELIPEPRPYQKKIFNNIRGNNSLVILPTGTGKTIIAYMLIIDLFKRKPDAKVLFLAPTKPLCMQHMNNFKNQVKGYDEPDILTGELSPTKRAKIWNNSPVVFATPQTIRNDLKNNLIDLSDLNLLIVDEAHRAVGGYAYVDVSTYFREQAKGNLLALTASPASERSKVKDICNALDIDNVESLSEEDLKEFLPEKEIIKVEVTLPDELKEIKKMLTFEIDEFRDMLLKEGYIRNRYVPKTALLSIQKSLFTKVKTSKNNKYYRGIFLISIVVKLQHALTVLELYGPKELYDYLKKLEKDTAKSSKALFTNGRFMKIFSTTEKILDSIEHPKFPLLLKLIKEELQKNKDVKVMVFVQYRNTTKQIYNYLKDVQGLNPVRFIGQAGEDGLKQADQIKIIEEFKKGKYNVFIATSISEEGIDIVSADVAILFEAVPSAIRSIQRRGRVGRLNFGRVYMLVSKDTIDSSYYFIAKRKENKMKKIIDDIKEDKQKRLDQIGSNHR